MAAPAFAAAIHSPAICAGVMGTYCAFFPSAAPPVTAHVTMTLRDMVFPFSLLIWPLEGERLEVSDVLFDMLDGILQGLDQEFLDPGLRDGAGVETDAEAGHRDPLVEDR